MSPIEYFNIADLVESNGKTVYENNLARTHQIPIGTLVEFVIDDEDMQGYAGVRLYVVRHSRDCDGEPLYVLAANKDEVDTYRMNGGWCESSIMPV